MWDLCTHSSALLKAVQFSYWIYQNKGISAIKTQDSAPPTLHEQQSSLMTRKPSTPQICQRLYCNLQY